MTIKTVNKLSSIEDVRERVLYLKTLLSQYDQSTAVLVENRLKYEVLTREPKLGFQPSQHPGQPPNFTSAADIATSMLGNDIGRQAILDTLLTAVGIDNLDQARWHVSKLDDALQRHTQLDALQRVLILRVAKAYTEAEKILGLNESPFPVADWSDRDREEIMDRVQKELDLAAEDLIIMTELPTPRLLEFDPEDISASVLVQ